MSSIRSRRRLVILVIAGAILVGLGLWAFVFSHRDAVITVQTDAATLRTLTQTVSATGRVQPVVKVDIAPEVSGEIVELPVKEGQHVAKGTLLFRIKPDVYMAARDQAAAAVSGAEAQQATAKANLLKAEQDFQRTDELHRRKLGSDQDEEGARAARDVARANLDAATHSIDQARATLKQTEETLRKTSVFAPMTGVVTALNSELGERVLGTQQFNGTVVLTVSDLSDMEVRVDVDENDIVLVHRGDTARVRVDAYPDRVFRGVVYQIAHSATTTAAGTQQEATNFQVRIRIVDPDSSFRPGMSATATIETETKAGVLTVPLQAVTSRLSPDAGAAAATDESEVQSARRRDTVRTRPPLIVFVVRDGAAHAQHVETGISSNDYIEITGGLTQGQEVVSGSFRAISKELEDGKKVRVDNGARGHAKPSS